MTSIPINKEHGVGPVICECFWCGKEKNMLALIGGPKMSRLEKEMGYAPRSMVVDYDPCDKCKEGMSQGITFMEAKEVPTNEGQPAMQEGVYPTGRWFVITEDAANRLLNDGPMKDATMRKRAAFLHPEVFRAIAPAKDIEPQA